MPARTTVSAFAAVLLVTGGVAPARPDGVPPAVREALGPTARAVAGGYEVPLPDGRVLTTHGPDHWSGREPDFTPGGPERPPICANEFAFHVVYARLRGSPNRYAYRAARIRSVIARSNYVLNDEARRSGGRGADLKVVCDWTGRMRIDPLEVSDHNFWATVVDAVAAGYVRPDLNYVVFMDARGRCGAATMRRDERAGPVNSNVLGGGFAVIWEGCWDGFVPLHEMTHLMGAVAPGAPHSTGSGGHCNEYQDVMCYIPDGGDRNQSVIVDTCTTYRRYDCGFDDYFDAAPEPGEYLDTHWNVGSPYNPFLRFR